MAMQSGFIKRVRDIMRMDAGINGDAQRIEYPNEVSVYWESDEFVCYKIVQNPYRLFNFAIDYDYNLRVYPVREVIEE